MAKFILNDISKIELIRGIEEAATNWDLVWLFFLLFTPNRDGELAQWLEDMAREGRGLHLAFVRYGTREELAQGLEHLERTEQDWMPAFYFGVRTEGGSLEARVWPVGIHLPEYEEILAQYIRKGVVRQSWRQMLIDAVKLSGDEIPPLTEDELEWSVAWCPIPLPPN